MEFLDNIKDERVNCYSILCKMSAKEYLDLVSYAYENKGGLKGQRSPLKTKSAQRIRKRMMDDIQKQSVIPPIVVGIRIEEELFNSLIITDTESLNSFITSLTPNKHLSIIDGMQRTTAILDARDTATINEDYQVRVEFWVSKSTNSLIYRMLVLNSGQIPWNLKRQLGVVFTQFTTELENSVSDLKLIETDEGVRRSEAGIYQASDFIELFILFGARRVSVDLQAELAEEFTRLDLTETSGNAQFMECFVGISSILVKLDKAFSILTTNPTDIELKKYRTGFSIFSSQPARAAFVTACAQEIFGILGMQYDEATQLSKFHNLIERFNQFLTMIPENQQELFDFLDLPSLDERATLRSNKVGEYERNFFLSAFKTLIQLIKSDNIVNMTPCWSNYQ